MIANVLTDAFARSARSVVARGGLTIEKVGSEMNPHFANIVSPTEIVVVTRFGVDLDGVGGDLHVAMPYSMIEPLREVLDSGMQSDRVEQDDRWSLTLRAEVGDADVEVRAVLGPTTITLSELLKLQAGDVIPTDFTGAVTLMAEDVPMFRGNYGHVAGQYAVKVTELIQRSLVSGLDDLPDGHSAVKAARPPLTIDGVKVSNQLSISGRRRLLNDAPHRQESAAGARVSERAGGRRRQAPRCRC